MPNLNRKQFETFNDGVLEVLVVSNRTIKSSKGGLRYGNRTVGIVRFYNAKVSSSTIDRLVAVPKNKTVNQNDLIIIDDVQYKVELIQDKFDTKPPCLYLTLKKESIAYTDERK